MMPLLPGAPARRCRCCRRPIRVGPVIDGYGIECARRRGLTPPPQPRMPKAAPQEGPTLLDWQTDNRDDSGDREHETDHA